MLWWLSVFFLHNNFWTLIKILEWEMLTFFNHYLWRVAPAPPDRGWRDHIWGIRCPITSSSSPFLHQTWLTAPANKGIAPQWIWLVIISQSCRDHPRSLRRKASRCAPPPTDCWGMLSNASRNKFCAKDTNLNSDVKRIRNESPFAKIPVKSKCEAKKKN